MCLKDYIDKLLPLLVEHAKNEEEQIRNIVAESVGRLFVVYSSEMLGVIEDSFKSQNTFQKATIVKSLKYGASKETDHVNLEMILGDLINVIKDKDLNVKRNALESLNAIVHN
mmetsp:Transcript_36990/g.35707  ORF Transcript_36990/g.35707 Transcript_36990/m.35707 type:complete len:113 (-) Transcript_36990:63-401(-)|eukprot:CAMPEP_0170545030 /NCGR_PEP_ID=MMETSP0211-20121228/3568_1 /TAXON_ID=311385 /ORGANISM="Pseudokeronopsis sp., Strain OXSARD2" /LENGTH=112 /DNA_ID=CAMNT_0010848827 /DNA_START=2806 /DNA_END=3144 /DNA_ORIENTATION=-